MKSNNVSWSYLCIILGLSVIVITIAKPFLPLTIWIFALLINGFLTGYCFGEVLDEED